MLWVKIIEIHELKFLKTIENNAEFYEFDQDLHNFGTMYQNVRLDGVEKMHTDKYISTGNYY